MASARTPREQLEAHGLTVGDRIRGEVLFKDRFRLFRDVNAHLPLVRFVPSEPDLPRFRLERVSLPVEWSKHARKLIGRSITVAYVSFPSVNTLPLARIDPPFQAQLDAFRENDKQPTDITKDDSICPLDSKVKAGPRLNKRQKPAQITTGTTMKVNEKQHPSDRASWRTSEAPLTPTRTADDKGIISPTTRIALREKGREGYSTDETPRAKGRRNRETPSRKAPNSSARKRTMFPEYTPLEDLEAGLLNGTLYSGKLRISTKNSNEAFLSVAGFKRDIAIIGSKNRNRAFSGDTVAIRILSEKLSTNTTTQEVPAVQSEALVDSMAKLELGSEISESKNNQEEPVENAEQEDEEERQALAHVVGILEAVPETRLNVPGFLRPFEQESMKFFVQFVPFDRSVPLGLLPSHQWPEKIRSGDKDAFTDIYTVDYSEWLISQRQPQCCIRECIGSAGHIEPETEALLRASKIHQREDFPTEVIEELRGFAAQGQALIQQEEKSGKRRDLRSQRIFSIDPTTAKDLDDALHITPLPDGTFEGSRVDEEAKRRCTSVYLVQKVIPMLPSILCEELCSLNPGVDRLAFSVIWRMNSMGHVCKDTKPWFGRTIIRSCCKLDYGTAQRLIDGELRLRHELPAHVVLFGDTALDAVIDDCRALHALAQQRRAHRFESGSLSLDRPKMDFSFDDDRTQPLSVQAYELHDTNRLVEEYMLLANQLVARHLVDNVAEVALLRRHDAPRLNKLQEVIELCRSVGCAISGESAETLHKTLQSIDNEAVRGFIGILISVAMKRAEYFCVQNDVPEAWYHYALNFDTYTHFTSPIRRYADVLVHRMLSFCVGDSEYLPNTTEVSQMASRCNEMKNRAKDAQDLSLLMYLSVLLRKQTLVEEAFLIDFGIKTCRFYIPRLGLEERFRLDSIPDTNARIVVADENQDRHVCIDWKSAPTQRIGLFEGTRVELSVTDKMPYRVELKLLPPIQ